MSVDEGLLLVEVTASTQSTLDHRTFPSSNPDSINTIIDARIRVVAQLEDTVLNEGGDLCTISGFHSRPVIQQVFVGKSIVRLNTQAFVASEPVQETSAFVERARNDDQRFITSPWQATGFLFTRVEEQAFRVCDGMVELSAMKVLKCPVGVVSVWQGVIVVVAW